MAVPSIRCGSCVRTIEECLSALPGVLGARANLTTHRVRVTWDAGAATPPILATLARAGFAATISDAGATPAPDAGDSLPRHVKAMAVAGFAAGNVMMLSVAVWSGADGTTRTLFHVLSAAIALPALAYAGRLFFLPAWRALRHGHVSMDVPISIGVVVTAAMSTYDTVVRGEAVYFDAALMLVFFLLVGRTLELRMRARAHDAADAVSRFEPRGADVLQPDGGRRFVALEALRAGDRLSLGPGERLAVDAEVEHGRSSVDRSLVSGESVPVDVAPGARLHAGTLNLVAPLVLRATADARGSFLAAIREAMREAEATKGRYRDIADRAAVLYAPFVHSAAALATAGWFATTGDLHRSLGVGVAVLIITCPCALGLAVPVVQVIAARRLFEAGVLAKDGAALERLADIDTVVFDKTGTLTTGRADWTRHRAADADDPHGPNGPIEAAAAVGSRASAEAVPPPPLAIARALARASRHPHARALMNGATDDPPIELDLDGVVEIPGAGLEGSHGLHVYRLGRADWALEHPAAVGTADTSCSVLSRDGRELATFLFHDTPRDDARRCLDELAARRIAVELLSGDASGPVERVAASLGIARRRAAMLPADKLARVRELESSGHRVLMVGDGVNDSPALAAAHVSMAPGSATDIGRRSADVVLLEDRLMGVPDALSVARRARRLVRQNLLLAVLYNVCAMPLAVAGVVTPLVAALSMSLSSVLVIANALRLSRVTLTSSAPVATSTNAGEAPGTERRSAARADEASPA